MNWPTSQDYNEAVQVPAVTFSDPALRGGEVVVNALGLPVPRSGNFADVYQFQGADGRTWALKCFTRKVAGLKERYARIDQHLNKAGLPFTVGFQFLQDGVKVRGDWYPLLKMEWVEGFTFNDFVAANLGKPQHLHALVQMWARLAGRLRGAGMAHADLQHGNVLLVPGATPQKLGLKLIDYDGMWVPALADSHSGEVGHPNFQHPRRLKDRSYNGDVDRFPHLVIAAGLRAALVGGKAVWDRFDNGDNLLFKEADLRDPARAQVFKALWDLNDPVLRTLVGHIALSSREPLRETPWLDHVLLAEGGPKLTREQERRACELLGVAARAPVPAAGAAPAGVAQQFNVFEFLDDDEDRAAPPAAGSGAIAVRRPRRTPRKRLAPLLVAAAIAAILVGAGAILAVGRGGKEKEGSPKVVRGKDGDPPKPDRGSAPKKDPAEVKVPVKEKDPVPPPPTRADETPPAATPDPSRPEYVTAARRRANLLVDGSFEREPAKHWEPQSWRRNDDAAAFVTDVARSGKASAKLRSTEFDDCMVGQTVAVKPGTQYLLSGWVRTKNVSVEDGGRVAASLSVAGGFEASPSIAVADDWAYASLVFDTGERKEVRVGARLGHHGSCAKGTAWFDDIVLIELGTPAE